MKQQINVLRGVPREVQLFFLDKERKRHSVYIKFFTQNRVSGEPDLEAIFTIFEKMFPGRTLDDNMEWPGDEDMATVNIHVSEDLERYTATLIKGDQAIPLATAPRPQVLDLEPHAYYLGNPTPHPEVLKIILYGPPQ